MLETAARDRIMVALDCDRDRAFELADLLAGHAAWLKVGMTLFYAEGPAIVRAFKDRGFKVFLDLKLHDIPHQVRGAARSAALAGADLIRRKEQPDLVIGTLGFAGEMPFTTERPESRMQSTCALPCMP